jgi:hypothetical protein
MFGATLTSLTCVLAADLYALELNIHVLVQQYCDTLFEVPRGSFHRQNIVAAFTDKLFGDVTSECPWQQY